MLPCSGGLDGCMEGHDVRLRDKNIEVTLVFFTEKRDTLGGDTHQRHLCSDIQVGPCRGYVGVLPWEGPSSQANSVHSCLASLAIYRRDRFSLAKNPDWHSRRSSRVTIRELTGFAGFDVRCKAEEATIFALLCMCCLRSAGQGANQKTQTRSDSRKAYCACATHDVVAASRLQGTEVGQAGVTAFILRLATCVNRCIFLRVPAMPPVHGRLVQSFLIVFWSGPPWLQIFRLGAPSWPLCWCGYRPYFA